MSDATDASLLETQGNNGDDTTSVDTKPTWTEQVKGDLRDNEILGRFGTVTEAAQRLIELEGSTDNAIVKPGEDATDEEMTAYLNALGRPESADGYEFTIPEEVPENARMGDDELSALKGEFHAEGLTQKQADFIMNKFNNILIEGDKAQKAAAAADLKAGQEAINEAWGADAKTNLEKANRVVTKFGGDEFKSFLNKNGLANSPEMAMLLYNISTVIAEDTMMSPPEKGTGELRRTAAGTPMLDFSKSMPGA